MAAAAVSTIAVAPGIGIRAQRHRIAKVDGLCAESRSPGSVVDFSRRWRGEETGTFCRNARKSSSHMLILQPATSSTFRSLSSSQRTFFKVRRKCAGLGLRQCETLNPMRSGRKNVVEFSGVFGTGQFPGGTSLDLGNSALPFRASSVSGKSPAESSSFATVQGKPFKNRLLGISKFGSVINDAAESFFKSEIRRRIFVTVALILASRVGYFIPIPGFDRRFMPGDYLALVSGAVEELGDLVSELKLAVFQLGISPYIFSSIVMQVACHLIPSLSKLRKEGLDGNEKIKKYTWWLAVFIAVLESLVVSLHSAQYSLYAAHNSFSYILITSGFLTLGAMSINWICEKITEAGFGQGSSLIICISILTGYSENLYRMISNLLNGVTDWVPLGLFLGCFILITMWAVVVTEGRRKVKLQYYDFELASSAGSTSALPEVEPYIPFNINPTGMQPVLTTTYLMAVPAVIAGLTGNKLWIGIRDTLNPSFPAAPGAKPWLYYLLNAMFIFIFNVLDIMDTPKEVADYMMKIGARIPNVKPGRRTIEYLSKVQASTRFWGGLLLALLATVSTLVDYRFRSLHQGGTIGFTSMLIIVGSIVELRRSFMAYNVMPSLSKVLRRYGV